MVWIELWITIISNYRSLKAEKTPVGSHESNLISNVYRFFGILIKIKSLVISQTESFNYSKIDISQTESFNYSKIDKTSNGNFVN